MSLEFSPNEYFWQKGKSGNKSQARVLQKDLKIGDFMRPIVKAVGKEA